MPSIDVRGVTLDYPVYSVRAKSLRSAVFGSAIGGKLLKTASDMTVVRALSNVQFSIGPGDRLGVMGHNGSGKTSLLKVLAGVYEPSQGELRMEGHVSSMLSMSIGLDHEASGMQNIRHLVMMQSLNRKQVDARIPGIVEFSELGPYIHMPYKTYSAGMMARLTFAVATSGDPDILLMDEWISAGDASFRNKAGDRMKAMFERAGLVVLATHDPGLIDRVCNKVMVLNGGRVEYFGAIEEWRKQSAAA